MTMRTQLVPCLVEVFIVNYRSASKLSTVGFVIDPKSSARALSACRLMPAALAEDAATVTDALVTTTTASIVATKPERPRSKPNQSERPFSESGSS